MEKNTSLRSVCDKTTDSDFLHPNSHIAPLIDIQQKSDAPEEFLQALLNLRKISQDPKYKNIVLEEVPISTRLSPYTVAISAQTQKSHATTTGKFIFIYNSSKENPDTQTVSIKIILSTPMTLDLIEEPLLAEVIWSWLTESIEEHSVQPSDLTGTVTRNLLDKFGAQNQTTTTGIAQVHASWTCLNSDLHHYFQSFLCMLNTLSGHRISCPYIQGI